MHPPLIQVFIGTKAQYIKTAPLLRLMDQRQIPYRLIDSGQHAELAKTMRAELGVREPDVSLGGQVDVTTIGGAVRWSLSLARRLTNRNRLLAEVFGGAGGICVVHGDTPSTLLSMLMARRAGLEVAHLEAGLRSHNILHPFPEEIIRLIVMRYAELLFAPTPEAVDNLESQLHRGRIVELEANTSIEAVRYAYESRPAGTGPVVVTMHRVENLKRPSRVAGWVDLVVELASQFPVRFVMHKPTEVALQEGGHLDRIRKAGVEISGMVSHDEFIRLLAAAPLAVIDGGSIQEECAYLGTPTLLWREHTEREDGIGENIVLSKFERAVAERFLSELADLRREPRIPDLAPSETILDTLVERVARRESLAVADRLPKATVQP